MNLGLRRSLTARTVLLLLAVAAVGGAVSLPGTARAADEKVFTQQRVMLTNKLKSKTVAGRLEAVKQLGEYPFAESAKLLMQNGLRDDASEVRRASYETLLKFKDSLQVCDLLIETLSHEARRATPDPNSPLFLSVLLSSGVAYVDQSSRRFVEETVAKHKDGAAFMVTLVDLLATHGEPDDLVPLRKVVKTSLFEESFGLRRAVVQTLTVIHDTAAVEMLIDILPKVEGEVAVDIMYHLSLVTDKKFGDRGLWADWWLENRATFMFPKNFFKPAERDFGRLNIGDTSAYYGLPLYGQRVVFVIDNSGSMLEGGRLEAAKRELIRAVQGLKDNQQFAILVFSTRVAFWKRELVDANTANKLDAARYVTGLSPSDRTCTYDALAAAFYFDAESIYLLTDGAPTSGKIVAPAEIVRAITLQNRSRRASIYTIGLAPGPEGSIFEVFLSELAKNNFGVFKRVDE